MTNRNTASFFALDAVSIGRPGAASLRRRFVFGAGLATILVSAVALWGGDRLSTHYIDREAEIALGDAARRSSLLVDRVLSERQREVAQLSIEPTVTAALAGNGTDRARQYLRALQPSLDATEISILTASGTAVLSTGAQSGAASDDSFKQALANGMATPVARTDETSGRPVVELAQAVVSGGARAGVVEVKFALAALDTALSQASGGTATRLDLVDAQGRLLASSSNADRMKPVDNAAQFERLTGDSLVRYSANGKGFRAAVASSNRGNWRLVALTDDASILASWSTVRMALPMAVVLAGALLLLLIGAADRFVRRRITDPAAELAMVAEAVAAGDLSQQVRQMHADDEIGRLGRAVSAMVMELRRLAGTMASSSHETAIMSAEITAGSEEMAASAGEIASTASDLSEQASSMAQTIQKLTTSADELATLAGSLAYGAHEGVERNVQLSALALENRTKLDESAAALETLTAEVRTGAEALERLAVASAEVKTFVALVQKLARQSKLLALNAAMEAARAGEHGEGFAVVAAEVRRLAAMSSDAAERTQQIVADVLAGVEQSRSSSERSVVTVRDVRDATQHASRSFGLIEVAVKDAEAWTNSIEGAADSTNRVAEEVRTRVASLAAGIDSFAAAMEEVAASSEQQSASTQEIAAAAATLSTAAERLQSVVRGLRLDSADAGVVSAAVAHLPPARALAPSPARA